MFGHHKRNLYTWISPGDKYRNQIDYIMVKNRWKSSIRNCKTHSGADCDTDHILPLAKMRVKLARNKAKQKQTKVDLRKLENPTIRTTLRNETDRSFEEHLNQLEDQATEELSENLWTKYKTVLTATEDKLWITERLPKKQ